MRGIGRGGGAAVPAGRSLGGVQSELEEKTLPRSVQRGSGPDGPMGRSTPVLRGCGGGQLSLSYAGGEESRWRAGLPARRSERAAAAELGGGCGVGG